MVESLSCGTGWPTRKRALRRSPLDSWTHVPVLVTHVAVLVLGLAWIAACGGDAPRKPQPDAPAAATAPATPPDGRARIALPARDTSTYRIVASVEGEAEVQPILADPDGGSWRRQRASSDTELVYHALPAPHAPEGEIGAALVLDALRHRTIRRDDTGATLQTELELAEDRLRLSQDDKVTSDLRGAQPQEGLTPRMLLARPFALLREDLEGRVITIAPQPSGTY